MADAREAQVRRYAPDGRLVWWAGRKGGGPGEFYVPACTARLPSGNVVVIDRNGRLTTFDSTASSVVGTIAAGIIGASDCRVVNDSTLLIAGRLNGDREGPRLHVWNLARQRVDRSFFAPFANAVDKEISHMAGWTRISLHGDTVAATFSTSDTIYFFTVDGVARGQVPVPSRLFRRDPVPPPRHSTQPEPGIRQRWLSQFDFIENVFWLTNGTLLVPYQRADEATSDILHHHLVAMTPDGRLLFESRDVPRLLNVEPSSGTLYFVQPGAETRNRWAVARLR